jgi:dipeptidyl aminopeptidase/acylaminoacyl peptidase
LTLIKLRAAKRSLRNLFLGFGIAMGLSIAPLPGASFTAKAAPSAKAFGELPVAYDAAISPDGERIAVVVNVRGEYGVLVKKMGNNAKDKPLFITMGKKLKPNWVKWANNKRWMVSVRRQDEYRGTPYTMRFLLSHNIETNKSGLVVDPKKIFRQVNDRVIDWLEDDPDHILMAYSDNEFDPFPDIKKVNIETGRDKTVQRSRLGVEYWMTDSDGIHRLGWGRTDNGTERMRIHNPMTDKWDDSDDYPGLEADTRVFAIKNGGTQYIIGDYQGKDTLGLYLYDLKQKKIVEKIFHNDEYDASGVVMDSEGETVIGARYTADERKTELLDEYKTVLEELRSRFKDYTVSFVDRTEQGDTVLVKMSAPYDPGGLYVFSRGDDYPSLMAEMYRGLESKDMGNVVSTRYTARDGQIIPAYVTLPPTIEAGQKIENLPFIVLPHGGPYARDAKRFDYFAQFFATRGYGVLQMNFRGSEGFGKAFSEAGRSNWVVMQNDVEDGARWLLEKGYADPKRFCAVGWSYGGYAALMGVAKDPDLYSCAISMAGLTDIDRAKIDMGKYRHGRRDAKEFFGEAFQDKSLRKANSPVNVAHQIKVPVFLAHGEQDENVFFNQFERMKKALRKAKVPSKFLAFENENHYLSNQKNREEFFIEVEKFLRGVHGESEYMKP